jgi:hypothetical protein
VPDRQDRPISSFWLRLYPELRLFESREQIREADRAWAGRSRRLGKRLLIELVILVLAAAALGVVLTITLLNVGAPTWLAPLVNGVVVLLLSVSVLALVAYRPYTRFLRRYLNERGVPVCMRCGYDLRAIIEPRCPECGSAFEPHRPAGLDGQLPRSRPHAD